MSTKVWEPAQLSLCLVAPWPLQAFLWEIWEQNLMNLVTKKSTSLIYKVFFKCKFQNEYIRHIRKKIDRENDALSHSRVRSYMNKIYHIHTHTYTCTHTCVYIHVHAHTFSHTCTGWSLALQPLWIICEFLIPPRSEEEWRVFSNSVNYVREQKKEVLWTDQRGSNTN